MTAQLRQLVQKWREAALAAHDYAYPLRSQENVWKTQCADELESALSAPPGSLGEAAIESDQPVVVQTAPEQIWLQVGEDVEYRDKPFPIGEEITWCQDSVLDVEVKYIRADLAAPPSPQRAMAGARTAGHADALALLAEKLETEHLFSDAMDAAVSSFTAVRHGIKRNTENAGEQVDGEKVMRRSLQAAFIAYLEEQPKAPPATQREEDHSIPLHPKHNDGQEDAALDLLEAAKNTLYGIFKGDPHATHNAANMRNRIDVFLQGRQIDRLAARQQPLAATGGCKYCGKLKAHPSDTCCFECFKSRAAPKVATDTSGTEAGFELVGYTWTHEVGMLTHLPKDYGDTQITVQPSACGDCNVPLFTRSAPDGEPGKSAKI